MFSKPNLISTLVAGIWSFMGGYLLWGILTVSFFEAHSTEGFLNLMKVEPDFPILALGCFLQAFIFSVIYKSYGAGKYSAKDGLAYGILVGILVGFGNGLIDYAVENAFDSTGFLVNGLVYIVFFGVMGLLSGLVYQKV